MSGTPERPIVTTQGLEHVDASELTLTTVAQVWKGRPGNKHLWTIQAIYVLDEPEVALDDMCLDVEKLIGFTMIHCLYCGKGYALSIRDLPCEATPSAE